MTRIVSATAAAVLALVASSCCCTSDAKPPKLRPLPQFQEIAPVGPAVEATKFGALSKSQLAAFIDSNL